RKPGLLPARSGIAGMATPRAGHLGGHGPAPGGAPAATLRASRVAADGAIGAPRLRRPRGWVDLGRDRPRPLGAAYDSRCVVRPAQSRKRSAGLLRRVLVGGDSAALSAGRGALWAPGQTRGPRRPMPRFGV